MKQYKALAAERNELSNKKLFVGCFIDLVTTLFMINNRTRMLSGQKN